MLFERLRNLSLRESVSFTSGPLIFVSQCLASGEGWLFHFFKSISSLHEGRGVDE